jgi:hypothetical protein
MLIRIGGAIIFCKWPALAGVDFLSGVDFLAERGGSRHIEDAGA